MAPGGAAGAYLSGTRTVRSRDGVLPAQEGKGLIPGDR